MDPGVKREFSASNVQGALEHIDAMPAEIRRIKVDVWEKERGWRFAYGDDRARVPKLLALLVQGRRFRVAGIVNNVSEREAVHSPLPPSISAAFPQPPDDP